MREVLDPDPDPEVRPPTAAVTQQDYPIQDPGPRNPDPAPDPPQEKAAKEGRKVGAASADATPPLNVAAGGGAAGGPPPGLIAPGAAATASVPAPLGSRAGSGTSSVSGAPEVHVILSLSCRVLHSMMPAGDTMCAMHHSCYRRR